jgi:hypothetical protein
MHLRSFRRAVALAMAGVLAVAAVASADSVRADGDLVQPGGQTFIDLGEVGPSAEITVAVAFTLVCGHFSHVDPGQTVTVSFGGATAPLDGDIIASESGTVGPVPSGWTADGDGCPEGQPSVTTGTTGSITLRAPSTAGEDYVYSTLWDKALSPAGANDAGAFNRTPTGLSFRLDVVGNTPPILTVPADVTIEGDAAGGWHASYVVSALDAEDDPDPTPDCTPAPGNVLPLGTTTVSCTVTDDGDLSDTGTFDVTVVDTTAPALAGVPADISVTSADPAGASVSWTAPTASDIVDVAPTVGCLPASGTTFTVGDTAVTCTASDASGNETSRSFTVHVDHVPPVEVVATWLEPLSPSGATFAANRGRTLPVKVSLSVDGTVRTTGDVGLVLVPCGGGDATTVAMAYGGGRWNASIDTSVLAGSCYEVHAVIDGLDSDGFRLELRGAEALQASVKGRSR